MSVAAIRAALRRVRPLPVVWLTVVYVALWGTWSAGNILNGALIAVGILVLLPLPDVSVGGRLHVGGALLYLLRFARDLLVGSIQVAWQAVRPGPQPTSAIVAIELRTRSELVMTVIAETVSLVPGSVVIDLDAERRILYAHVLSARTMADVEAFRRSVHVLETQAIRALGQAGDLDLLEAEETRNAEGGGS